MTRNALLMLVLVVAGCDSIEPYRRTDVWYPTGANAGNIAAMTVRPRDLIVGRHRSGTDSREAAGAIDRLWQEPTKPLPKGTGTSSAAAGATAPGGPN